MRGPRAAHGYHGGVETQKQPWRISPDGDYQKKPRRDEIGRLRRQFAQNPGEALGDVVRAGELERLVEQHAGQYRERVYGPLRTLGLFIGQALSEDGACQDAVARNLSERTGRGVPECRMNTGPYFKARQRLHLELVV